MGHRNVSCSDPGRNWVMPPSCSMSHMLPLLCVSLRHLRVSELTVGWYQVPPHTVEQRVGGVAILVQLQ